MGISDFFVVCLFTLDLGNFFFILSSYFKGVLLIMQSVFNLEVQCFYLKYPKACLLIPNVLVRIIRVILYIYQICLALHYYSITGLRP